MNAWTGTRFRDGLRNAFDPGSTKSRSVGGSGLRYRCNCYLVEGATSNPCYSEQAKPAKEARAYDKYTYKERHLIECFFNKMKNYGRLATRYDKIASMFKAIFGVDFDEVMGEISLRTGPR
ncbi:transposase [Brevibacillus antibioticus]|uniref:Transposase n=1 Tax=Brevibacillus antibioticus TaxID=2570228 RepID=A0A4U2YEF5_9BACL|nr:transposase [Brevibacillus antibioticus]